MILQKIASGFTLLVLLTTISSCYTSNMPLSWDKEVSEEFVGEWVIFRDNAYNDYITVKINEANNEFDIHRKWFDMDEEEYKESEFTGYLTRVWNDWFISFQLEEGDYGILKLTIEGDTVILHNVKHKGFKYFTDFDKIDDVIQFPDPDAFKEIVEQNIDNPDFFSHYETLEKSRN